MAIAHFCLEKEVLMKYVAISQELCERVATRTL